MITKFLYLRMTESDWGSFRYAFWHHLYEMWVVWAAVIFGAAVLAVFFGGMVYLVNEDAKRWVAFREAHKCKVVAHIKGDVFNTFGSSSNGQVVVGVGVTPDKKGWLCDDGVTYYR